MAAMPLPAGWKLRLAELLRTFMGEAAVLVFVFPVLDRFVVTGIHGVTWSLLLVSWIVSAILLGIAALIAVFQEVPSE